MLRIWGRANSSNVMKVLWLCDELGIAHERIDAGGAFGRTKEPDYLAKNPNALVPTLEEEDGFALWESNSILRYLARTRAPGHAIYPADPRGASEVERWMDWQLSAVTPPMTTIFFTYVRIPEPERDYAAAAKAAQEAAGRWRVVEARLAGRDFLCGAELTLADVAIGPFLHRWFALPVDRPELPALAAYHDRLKARPGYARWCAVKMT